MDFKHKSVLLDETIEMLNIRPGGIYVDGTLGGGGHSLEIVKRLAAEDSDDVGGNTASYGCEAQGKTKPGRREQCEMDSGSSLRAGTDSCGMAPGGRLIGIDQDADAIAAATGRLADYKDWVTIVRDNYVNMPAVLSELGIDKVDGIVLDLGVSSFQLDSPERGFTYRDEDAPLDMRMDDRQSLTARDIVNTYSEEELTRILRDYGEERFAKNIARRIVAARKDAPIETAGQLNDLIRAAIPAKMRQTGGHPSKRTYQALRIELNRELDVLKEGLDSMIDLLGDGGRICVITFHSLEDRIVKTCFKTNENPCTCPPDFPVCVCGKKSKGKVITRKPILPGEDELRENPRSASAKLRVFERRNSI